MPPMGVPLNMASGPAPTGQFFNSPHMPQPMAQQQQQQQTARREMRGPVGVDDILKTFEEVRRADEQGAPPSLPMNMPSSSAASDLQSLGSDDLGSVGTDRTGGGGGRRRKRAAPVGNVVSLNV